MAGSMLIAALIFSVASYAETKAPDDVVSKDDINKCLKHLRKTENFQYPNSLKVESAHYSVEEKIILLTLSISEKNEYGGFAGKQNKQCKIEK